MWPYLLKSKVCYKPLPPQSHVKTSPHPNKKQAGTKHRYTTNPDKKYQTSLNNNIKTNQPNGSKHRSSRSAGELSAGGRGLGGGLDGEASRSLCGRWHLRGLKRTARSEMECSSFFDKQKVLPCLLTINFLNWASNCSYNTRTFKSVCVNLGGAGIYCVFSFSCFCVSWCFGGSGMLASACYLWCSGKNHEVVFPTCACLWSMCQCRS